MVICECVLFLVAVVTLSISVFTDIRFGKVKNSLVVIGSASAFIVDILYYTLFAGEYVLAYLVNLFLSIVFSLLLYLLNLWGAGDSKLLILMTACMPGRLFCKGGLTSFPGFFLFSIVFACSFVILLFETLFISVSQKRKLRIQLPNKSAIIKQIKRIAFSLFIIGSVNSFIAILQNMHVSISQSLIYASDFCIILFLNNQEKDVSTVELIITGCTFAILAIVNSFTVSWYALLVSLVIIILIYLIQSLAGQDNYSLISAVDIQPGMILAPSSTSRFEGVDIKGLPMHSFGDMRSKLSLAEADAVRLWGKMQPDSNTLLVVKKIPFVLYIALGTLILWGLEVFCL